MNQAQAHHNALDYKARNGDFNAAYELIAGLGFKRVTDIIKVMYPLGDIPVDTFNLLADAHRAVYANKEAKK